MGGRCSNHVRAESARNNGRLWIMKLPLSTPPAWQTKPIILEPQSGVCFPGVFRDVGRRLVPRWEDGVENVSSKSLRPRQVGARASVLTAVVASTAMRVIAVASSLSQAIVGTPTGIAGVAC